MVWVCAEEGQWVYWTKDAKYGADRQEEVKENMQRLGVMEMDAKIAFYGGS